MKQYTMSEVAKLLNVSRQTVYNKINSQDLQPYIHDTDRGKILLEEGFQILKTMLGSTVNLQSKPVNDSKYIDTLIDSLKSENENLRRIVVDQSKQIENLTKLIENSQVLLKHEQEKNALLLESSEEKSKRRIWNPFKK